MESRDSYTSQNLGISKSQISAILTQHQEPALFVDPDSRILQVNTPFSRMSGMEEDSFFRMRYSDLPLVSRNGKKSEVLLSGSKETFREVSFRSKNGLFILEETGIHFPGECPEDSGTLVLFRDVTDRVRSIEAEEENRRKLLHDYGERVKEQTLFYATAKLIQDDSRSSKEILQDIVELVPPGWQYPEICEARIVFEGIDVRSSKYREVRWKQVAEFITKDGRRGTIEVIYLEEKPFESEGPFLAEERNLINSLAEMLKTYLDRKVGEENLEKKYREQAKLLHDYGERVKEQTLFYATAKLIQDDSHKWEQILDKIVQLIPPGWQYPEICAARIRFGDIAVTTPNYRETPWIQTAEFTIKSGKRGYVDVIYLEEKPFESEGPFLAEERNLINSLAEMLKTYLDRKTQEQALDEKLREQAKLLHDYGERVKEQTLFYATARLIQDDSYKWEQILDKIVQLIPPGWQYPEVCAARIRFEDVAVTTPNYRETPWIQTAEFTIKSGKRGYVDVIYLEEKPFESEGPFLKEERNLINSLSEMLKTYLDRKTQEQALDEKFREIESIRNYMEKEVAGLSSVYAKMGSGDLTLRYEFTEPDTHTRATYDQLVKMRNSVRGIIESLQKNIRDVNTEMEKLVESASNAVVSIQDASRGITDIAENSTLVSTNAKTASNDIDQILQAVGDLSASVEEITASMDEVSTISREANDLSRDGATLAEGAESNMGEIAHSTEKVAEIVSTIERQMADISKIVGLIRDIANQTNLLALNAAIEAARAGDAGRGFAVVAAEVKSLALESKNSAEQIEEVISTLKAQAVNAAAAMGETKVTVAKGSAAVSETQRAFTQIAAAVGKVAASASEVASATGEQARTTTDITGMVNEITELIRATAQEAEGSAASTEEASSAIEKISGMVEQVNAIAQSALRANQKFRV